jgi:hypothetical protein
MYKLTVYFYDTSRFLPQTFTVDDDHVPDLNGYDEFDTVVSICTFDESVYQFNRKDVFSITAVVAEGY